MPEDFGDVYDFDAMTDDEIYDVVRQHLREYPEVDSEWVEVDVRDGHVTLSGRVSTDQAAQVAAKVVTEVLGVADDHFTSDLMVSELHRGEAPEPADQAVVQDEEVDDQLGEPLANQSDTAEHLVQDLESETYGTHDMGEAIEEGTAYAPPDRPISDGYTNREHH